MLYESEQVHVEADDGTATLWLDFPGDPPNLLSPGRMTEVGRAVAAVAANPFAEILVVRSAKPAGFSAGYDPESLLELDSESDRHEVAAAGQRVMRELAAAPFVTLAYLDGPCLGAGLELALACDYRLAVAAPEAALGFPEVPNGFVPGWGGMTRLVRLIGLRAASEWILSGRPISARRAKAVGLVDHAFCARRAKIELRTFLDTLRDRPRKPHRRRRDWFATGRAIRAAARTAAGEAGAAAVRVAAAALRSEADGLAAERREFVSTLGTPAARAGLELLCQTHRPVAVRPQPRNPVPPFPGVVGVVGNFDDINHEIAIRGGVVVRVGDSLRESPPPEAATRAASHPLSIPRLTPLELAQAASRLRVTREAEPWAGFADAGLVLADADARLPEIEAHTRPRAVIAVVGQPVAAAQEVADRPGRVVGLTLPVFPDESNLVEVVAGPETEADAVAALAAWVRRLGFVPAVVSDRPNQVVRRVLAAAWDEAVRLVAEGVPVEAIDRAGVAAGFRRGPLETLDAVGLAAAKPLVPLVAPLVAAGITGRPGDGFYLSCGTAPNVFAQIVLWEAACLDGLRRGRPVQPESEAGAARRAAAARDRLAFRVVNEAAAALGDESHAGPAEIDFAVALGANLFRPAGGPLRFADGYGLRAAAARLTELAKAFGRRFQPHPELARRAAAGERFHEPRPAAARPLAA